MTTPTATAARDHLVRALEADLVGPFDLDQAETFEEILRLPPSRWYLTGFLAPEEGRQVAGVQEREDETDPRMDPTVDEELAVGPDEDGEDAEPVRR